MNKTLSAREAALKIMHNIRGGAYSNAALKEGLPHMMSREDKALATQLVYGVTVYLLRLDYDIAFYSKIPMKKISPWITDILRMGLYQLFFLDRIPPSAAVNESVKLARRYGHSASAGFVNGVLRRAATEGEPKLPDDLSVIYSHPKWLTDMWEAEYGREATEGLLEADNRPPEAFVRANTLKNTAVQLAERLGGEAVDELFVRVASLGGIENTEEYRQGLITVQGRASAEAVRALEPKKGQLIIDVCAAPGGKSTLAAQLMENEGEIIACDIYSHKLELIEKNAARLGIDIIKTRLKDAREPMEEYAKKADCVLADVPCSGLGIIGKKPDIRWSKEPADIESLCRVQRKILSTAAGYVKTGGRLVYSTCTVSKAENEQMVEEFLRENSGFKLIFQKQYFPHIDKCDGFFIGAMLCTE